MNDKEWDRFFDLLVKIVNGNGSWQERRDRLRQEAKARDLGSDLDELAGWLAPVEES